METAFHLLFPLSGNPLVLTHKNMWPFIIITFMPSFMEAGSKSQITSFVKAYH